jgi:hypothetical protein
MQEYMVRGQKMTPGEKATLTRTLRKLFPETAEEGLTWDQYSEDEIRKAKEFIQKRKRNREKRQLVWTKIQIAKYLDFIGQDHNYTAKTVPNKLVNDLSKNKEFLAYKKFEGYRLLFRKIKGYSAKSNQEVLDFIKLLAKERRQKERTKKRESTR